MAHLLGQRLFVASGYCSALRIANISRYSLNPSKRMSVNPSKRMSSKALDSVGASGPAWMRRRRNRDSTLNVGAAGLVWLDKSLSMRHGMPRVSTKAIKSVMAAGGHRGGFAAMHQLQHKTLDGTAFYSEVVAMLDDAERCAQKDD